MANILIPGTATPADVLSTKKFSAGTSYGANGTMPNVGTTTLTASGTAQVAIPQGYHDGTGKVAQVTVPAANVLTGVTIAGVAGTMPNRGAVTITPSNAPQSISSGYHSGSGSVPAVVVPAGSVLTGTTIAGTTGTMPNQTGYMAPYDGSSITGTAYDGVVGRFDFTVPAGYYTNLSLHVQGVNPANVRSGVRVGNSIGGGYYLGTLAPKYTASGTIAVDSNSRLIVGGFGFTPIVLLVTFGGASWAYHMIYDSQVSTTTYVRYNQTSGYTFSTGEYVNSSGFNLTAGPIGVGQVFYWWAWA